MLRACARVLKPGGRMVFTVIGTVDGEASPPIGTFDTFMAPAADYFAMVQNAGFEDVRQSDVTGAFMATAVRWLEAAAELDNDLRSVLGDAVMDEKLASRRDTFAALEAGEICRLLISATA